MLVLEIMPIMPNSNTDYMGVTTQNHGPVALKWDPKNLEIRTTSVERTLEPLVLQVETQLLLELLHYHFTQLVSVIT